MLKTFKQLLKTELGFTMIELMIVVVIIGVLAAIAVPVYAEAVQKSKISRAQADLRVLESALAIYYAENNSYPTKEEGLVALVDDYIKEVPKTPWNSDKYQENYAYDGKGNVYLVGTKENGIGVGRQLYSTGIKEAPSS